MDAGGRTPSQALAARAKAVGIDPTGMEPEELNKKVDALENSMLKNEQSDGHEPHETMVLLYSQLSFSSVALPRSQAPKKR